MAGIVLDEGDLAEMNTGDGKTLAAVAPAYLNALTRRPVLILTFNDYLAHRDAQWMGLIYQRLGLTIGVIQAGMATEERRRAYGSDVTYATAREAGSTPFCAARSLTTRARSVTAAGSAPQNHRQSPLGPRGTELRDYMWIRPPDALARSAAAGAGCYAGG